jgi:hypothetical protein
MLSTLLASWLSHRRTGAAAGASNATSQWVWGEPARVQDAPSLRHTAVGYVIHHLSAVFWAALFEKATPDRAGAGRVAGAAAATAAIAYVVDYHVVPRRLSPGYEGRTGGAGLAASYVACAAGLFLGRMVLERVSGHRRAPPSVA